MRLRLLLPFLLAAAAFLVPFLTGAPSAKGHDEDGEYMQRRKPGKCLCHKGKASWQYLRTPMRPPASWPTSLRATVSDAADRPASHSVLLCAISSRGLTASASHTYDPNRLTAAAQP